MWTESDDEVRPPSPSPGPAGLRVCRPRDQPGPVSSAGAAAAVPQIAQVNVSKNSRMHIGPKFVSVTQNVHNSEVVKEVGLARCVWEWVRRTSLAERLACAVALLVLALCGVLAAFLSAPSGPVPQPPDVPESEWKVLRRQWLAQPPRGSREPWEASYSPLRLVVVQHTVGPECYTLADCAATMRSLQLYYFHEFQYDVPYHFVVGNDGRAYEGRGWDVVGAHTRGYNVCALGLAFTGDYTEKGGSRPAGLQLNRTRRLLEGGVAAGVLHPRHAVLAARDVQDTASPGELLYEALRALPAFSADPHRFRDRSCDDIYRELQAADVALAATTAPPR